MTHQFPTRAYVRDTHRYWLWSGSICYRCTESGVELIEANCLKPIHLAKAKARRMDAFSFPRRTIQTWRMADRDVERWAATIALPESDPRLTTCSGLHFGTSIEEAVDTAYRTVRRVRRALAERAEQQKVPPAHVVGGWTPESVAA